LGRALSTPLLVVALAVPAIAQDKPEPAKKSNTMTMTGCLNKGEREDHYSFTDKNGGSKMTVSGLPDLAKHANNHT
jgi:hypothetical protein